MTIFNDLVLFDCDWRDMSRFRTYAKTDKRTISNQVTICSTRRFGHSVNKVYERCGLEFDEIMQRCVNSLRKFLTHETGKLWLQTTVQLYPAFLCKTFIDFEPGNQLSLKIAKTIQSQLPKETIAPLNSDGSITGLVKHLRECKKEIFYQSIVP